MELTFPVNIKVDIIMQEKMKREREREREHMTCH